MKVVLIRFGPEDDSGCFYDEEILVQRDRGMTLSYCMKVASGDFVGVRIKRIVEVDLNRDTITDLELKLNGFKLELVEKEKPPLPGSPKKNTL